MEVNGALNNLQEELEVYKTVAAMSGDILYKYDIAKDTISFYSGMGNAARYGTVINNYSQVLHRHGDNSNESGPRNFIHLLKHPDNGYFECETRLPGIAQIPKWFGIIGKPVYDDNNEPVYVVGKMTDIDFKKNIYSPTTGDYDFTDPLTGLLNKSGVKNKLAAICSKINGEEACFLNLIINGLKSDEDTVNVAQCLKRVFPFDVEIGRNKQNQFYIAYFGANMGEAFLSKLDSLIEKIHAVTVEDIRISGGVYVGPFVSGEEYEIRERAHMAMMASRLNNTEEINTYSADIAKITSAGKALVADEEFSDAEFDNNLVERTLDIMYHSGNVEEAITHIFTSVGKKYNIDRIIVTEGDNVEKDVNILYTWESDSVKYLEGMDMHKIIPDYDYYNRLFKRHDLIVCEDIETTEMPSDLKARMMTVGLKSIIHCAYTDNHKKYGSVGFENYGTKHKWTDKEIRTVKLITRLITVCLLNARSYEEMLIDKEAFETRDSLTGLYKYETFLAEAKNYVNKNKGQRLAIMYTGMKNFLAVNSRFGYDAGDNLLTAFANLMTNEQRFIMGSRINADNYVFLVKAFDTRGNLVSASTVNRLSEALFNQVGTDYSGVDISVTAGISLLDDDEPMKNHVKSAFEARGRAYNEGLDALTL